jgi:hypothetical protein
MPAHLAQVTEIPMAQSGFPNRDMQLLWFDSSPVCTIINSLNGIWELPN